MLKQHAGYFCVETHLRSPWKCRKCDSYQWIREQKKTTLRKTKICFDLTLQLLLVLILPRWPGWAEWRERLTAQMENLFRASGLNRRWLRKDRVLVETLQTEVVHKTGRFLFSVVEKKVKGIPVKTAGSTGKSLSWPNQACPGGSQNCWTG